MIKKTGKPSEQDAEWIVKESTALLNFLFEMMPSRSRNIDLFR